MSVGAAVEFAKANNLLGLLINGELLVRVYLFGLLSPNINMMFSTPLAPFDSFLNPMSGLLINSIFFSPCVLFLCTSYPSFRFKSHP